jgi:hypothetical protein
MANWTRLPPGGYRLRGRRRQTKYNAHTSVTSFCYPTQVHDRNNANRKHNNCFHSDICSTKCPRNRPRVVAAARVGLHVHHGRKRSTVVIMFPRRGLDGSQGTDRDNRHDCNLLTSDEYVRHVLMYYGRETPYMAVFRCAVKQTETNLFRPNP